MNHIYRHRWLAIVATALLLTSCGGGGGGGDGGGGQAQGKSPPDYKTVKTMVLDIIQTDEAKTALAKVMQDEKFKQAMIMDETMIKTTLIQSLGNPKNPQIKEAFNDPKFASQLAKTMKTENKNLIKDLMKDPEYQKMMISVMKDPEFERHLLEVMKSSAFRQQTMQIMKDAIQSPLFQDDMMKIMTKVNEEMTKPKKDQQQKGGGQGGGQGGGGGGGAGGGGGGGAGGQ